MSEILMAGLILAVMVGIIWILHRAIRHWMGDARHEELSRRIMDGASPIVGTDRILDAARRQQVQQRDGSEHV